ncbi:MAG: 23S rRNA (uracil(1939)-C(5))-methyltransferase RlmD [Clostridia bacterium]|nr:23S rRNA (uracil(1939)-C(5))-methyltransferase RlmD [Clostridia bacterium]
MKSPVEKNKEYIVEIIDNGFEGEGIAKIDSFTVFVPNALKGEKIRILIVKVLTSHAFGKILEIIIPSKVRVETDCKTYQRCGGCNLRHVQYEETLKIKQNAVQSLLNKTLKSNVKIDSILGMKNPYNYRNKAQYPIGIGKNRQPVMGVFANRTHEIIPIHNCLIQDKKTEEIAKFIFDYIVKNKISIYNEKTGKGLIRHIVTKIGKKTSQIMCILVINGREIPKEKELVAEIISYFPKVRTIVKNINTKNTNVILGQENVNLYGDGYIEDKLGEYTFKISPLSFYQVNPIQAEQLYQLGVDMAEITKEDVVFDLYCGIGSISLFMSQYAKKVYGIEIIKEAVEMAKENAKLNQIHNVKFIDGDVKEIFDELIHKNNIIPNIILVDPPRRGLDNNTINNFFEIKPKRLVYISCNPATLARDLHKLEELYDIKNIRLVDMFPFTSHVEVVSVLGLKEEKKPKNQ